MHVLACDIRQQHGVYYERKNPKDKKMKTYFPLITTESFRSFIMMHRKGNLLAHYIFTVLAKLVLEEQTRNT